VYHGRILLPTEYPFKPPSFMLLTPSGRFETQTKICLSITQHHPEHWQPSWSVRTALLAVRAFMPSPPEGAVGSLDYTPDERRRLAAKSRAEVPQFGSADRQALTQAVHERMVGRWEEIEARRKADKKAADAAEADAAEGVGAAGAAAGAAEAEGAGGAGGEGSSSSSTAVEGAAAAGVNEEVASTVNPWAAVAPISSTPAATPAAAPVTPPPPPPPPPPSSSLSSSQPAAAAAAAAAAPAVTPPPLAPLAPLAPAPASPSAPAPAPAPAPTLAAALAAPAPTAPMPAAQPRAPAAVGRPRTAAAAATDSPAVASLKRKLDFLALFLSLAIFAILIRKFLVS
jgi:hypothetical protein